METISQMSVLSLAASCQESEQKAIRANRPGPLCHRVGCTVLGLFLCLMSIVSSWKHKSQEAMLSVRKPNRKKTRNYQNAPTKTEDWLKRVWISSVFIFCQQQKRKLKFLSKGPGSIKFLRENQLFLFGKLNENIYSFTIGFK